MFTSIALHSTDSTLNTTAYAILRYGASTSEPTSADWTDVLPDDCVDLDDSQLVPIIARDAPATSDKVVAFDSSFGTVEIAGVDYNRFLVNSTSYSTCPLISPMLLDSLSSQPIMSTSRSWKLSLLMVPLL